MFKLTQSPAYWWPVELLQVEPDGEVAVATLRVQLRRLTVDEEDALMHETAAQALSDVEVARRVVLGMADLLDEHGAAVPYSDAARDKVLAQPGAASAIVAAFFSSRSQAALGNSRRSRADGPGKADSSATAPTITTH